MWQIRKQVRVSSEAAMNNALHDIALYIHDCMDNMSRVGAEHLVSCFDFLIQCTANSSDVVRPFRLEK